MVAGELEGCMCAVEGNAAVVSSSARRRRGVEEEDRLDSGTRDSRDTLKRRASERASIVVRSAAGWLADGVSRIVESLLLFVDEQHSRFFQQLASSGVAGAGAGDRLRSKRVITNWQLVIS